MSEEGRQKYHANIVKESQGIVEEKSLVEQVQEAGLVSGTNISKGGGSAGASPSSASP